MKDSSSLSSGIVPDLFKNAIIKPLIKKPNISANDMKNYRPVSNLPFLSKVLERLVLKRILHVDRNGFSECFQSAYKCNHSTETALLKLTSDILNNLDVNNACILTLLDLSSAFDTIDHSILLNRLHTTFGIAGRRSFTHVGPLVWNDLPKQIREAESLNSFKALLKHYLFTVTFLY